MPSITQVVPPPSGVQPVPRWQLAVGFIVFVAALVVGGSLDDPKGFRENATASLASNIGGAAFALVVGGLILDRWKQREEEAARRRWATGLVPFTRGLVNAFDDHLSLIAERLSDVYELLGRPGSWLDYRSVHVAPTEPYLPVLHKLEQRMGQRAEELLRNLQRLMPETFSDPRPIHLDPETVKNLAERADRLYDELRDDLKAVPELVSQVASMEDDQRTIRELLSASLRFESAQRKWDIERRNQRHNLAASGPDPSFLERWDAQGTVGMADAAEELLKAGHELHSLLTHPHQRAIQTMRAELDPEDRKWFQAQG